MTVRERVFRACLTAQGVLQPEAEYRFAPPRRWRFDYAWPAELVALEVEGGIWTAGRHVRGRGYLADMEKYNAAAVAGWRVLRVTPTQLPMPATARMIAAALEVTPGGPILGPGGVELVL